MLLEPIRASTNLSPAHQDIIDEHPILEDPDFGGLTSFNWVAIEESPDSANPVPDLITGVLPPMFFGAFRQSFGSNRTFEDHGFGGFGLFDSSVGPVLLTATDHNVQGHSV